jgi:formylglycine-generating enzyme required for sulfatase activity
MFGKTMVRGLLAVVLLTSAVSVQADVFHMPAGDTSLQFVTVGNPGNLADPATGNLYGSVGYTYQMGKYDVTLGQYCQFLNAVAKTDTYHLYTIYMMDGFFVPGIPSGISQSGSSGSYSYLVIGSNPQAANCPVYYVTWADAARFCNWLQNGQPTGAEGNGTTETGTYTLNGATSDSAFSAVTRNAGATYFLPTENEWYKAAYYDPSLNGGAGGYWTYATRSNTPPSNSLVLAPTEANDANYYIGGSTDPTNCLTPVGLFAASPSAYGTFDQNGDVWQLNETSMIGGYYRGICGGSWGSFQSSDLASSGPEGVTPVTFENKYTGFRVAAAVPEPSTLALLGSALLGIGIVYLRKRKAR